MNMQFTVKSIVKTELDKGTPEKEEKWVASLEHGEDLHATIKSDDEFDFKVGDEVEFRLLSKQKKLTDK
jgi:hypothetical protein